MKMGTITSTHTAGRLDAWYYLSPAVEVTEAIERKKKLGARTSILGGEGGIARVHHPQRYTRALAARGEDSLPYLRPYDVFNYYPEAADFVSRARTSKLDEYQLRAGQILQTRSGRNLGPAVIADAYLAGFVMSDDMIRIHVEDSKLRHYVLAYLNSEAGRSMLRRDKTGSVIDHLSESQVALQEVVFLSDKLMESISSLVERAVTFREEGRLALREALKDYERELPSCVREKPLRDGWTINARSIVGRIDAASYDPLVTFIREQLLRMGGRPVADFADVHKPATRYKTRYVGRGFGPPLLSGAQILQSSPINLQYMAPEAFNDVTRYELRANWIVYPADGRAEEELGTPALVTKDRDGWLASGHVGRIIPKKGVNAGWLFLALKTEQAQLQIKALASGSVVDSTFPNDMLSVVLPPQLDVDGEAIIDCWEKMRIAQLSETQASATVDQALAN